MSCPGKRDRFEIEASAIRLQQETALCYRMMRMHIASCQLRSARVWQQDGAANHEAMWRELRELVS